MRLAIADIPKSFTRRNGEVYVMPRLLRPGEAADALGALIGLYEASVGARRMDFPVERPAEVIGDYRLARCLTTCLGEWYQWESPTWPEPASEQEAAALRQRPVASPSGLRLALYDFVNTECGGFLPASERDQRLTDFAASLGVTRQTLDALLSLDAAQEARLVRSALAAPTAQDLASRYNQLAVESLLAGAASVQWRITPERDSHHERLGTVVKRVCFLARTMGVSYDVGFEYDLPGVETSQQGRRMIADGQQAYTAAPASLDRASIPVIITLYGPQEVSAAPGQYGERLARLCRSLLGYRRQAATPSALGGREALTGWASVYLRGKPFIFTLDERLLRLMRAGPQPPSAHEEDAETFDSSLERRLHRDFTALERAGETAGWRLEREPEPIVIAETILVPDFALTRDHRRVYLEVAGYWRPGYRERKARKLTALRGAVALIVAAPESARAEFAGLDGAYPFLWYSNDAISAPAIVSLLERAFDDFASRLAQLDARRILDEVERRGVVPTLEAMRALRVYTRAEVAKISDALAQAAATHGESPPEWIEGYGLCSATHLERLTELARVSVTRAGGRMALAELVQTLQAEKGAYDALSETVTESLARRAGLAVTRASLFSAEVMAPDYDDQTAPPTGLVEPAAERVSSSEKTRRAQPRKGVRRTHSGAAWSAGTLFPDAADRVSNGAEPDSAHPSQPTDHHQ